MREAIRYLGYGRNTADERTRMMIENAFTDVEKASGPKSICRVFAVKQTADGKTKIFGGRQKIYVYNRQIFECVAHGRAVKFHQAERF